MKIGGVVVRIRKRKVAMLSILKNRKNVPMWGAAREKRSLTESGKVAFTLAEVLITLVVVGVVAAVTVPMLLHQEGDRVNSERQANIVYKIAQATDLMKVHGALGGKFANTEEFVDELQKYLKINKRCDADHIAECWPTSKVKNMAGEEFEVKNAKTRGDLGFDDDYSDTNNVGLILADGANIILTYNPAAPSIAQGDEVKHEAGLLPVGNGKEEYLNYTSNTMGGLAFVVDVNGNRGPNSERQGDNGYKDIRSYNNAKFVEANIDPCAKNPNSSPCCKWEYDKKIAVGNICYFQLPTTYTWANAKTACPSGSTYAGSPSYTNLVDACNAIKSKNGNGTTSPFTSSYFWSASEGSTNPVYGRRAGYVISFPDCHYDDTYNLMSDSRYVLCAGN